MNFTENISVPLWLLFVLFLLAATMGCLIWYYSIDEKNIKLVGLVGGIVSGLVVAVFTFAVSVRPLQQLDHFQQMGIKALLANRHDKNYYQKLVGSAQRNVCVMGASCTRFVEDFLDMESDDKVLVDALRKYRQLRVQLLVPEERFMSPEAAARRGIVSGKMVRPVQEFGDRVELRNFGEKAQHSFVLADGDLIAGPIFESDKSKYAPAVHVATDTVFAQKYKQHFDDLWESSKTDI